MNAARAQADHAGEQGHQAGHDHRQRQVHPQGIAALEAQRQGNALGQVKGRDGRHIGPEAEKGRMAETDQGAIADDEIQAHGRNGEDQHPRHHRNQVLAAEKVAEPGPGQQQQEAGKQQALLTRKSHQAGNRPRGRRASTSAISR